MTHPFLRLPIPPLLERSPELAALVILDAALTASEAALLASHAELYYRGLDGLRRGSSVLHANSVIIHARPLAAALASCRDALDRDDRREALARNRMPFCLSRGDQHAADRGLPTRFTNQTP